jgi:hypothetical protein
VACLGMQRRCRCWRFELRTGESVERIMGRCVVEVGGVVEPI